MTHSLDEGMPQFLTQAFHESVQGLIAARGTRFAAEQLKMIGVSFDTAYELIFNRVLPDADYPIGSPEWEHAMERLQRKV